jgi:hypothetical protein
MIRGHGGVCALFLYHRKEDLTTETRRTQRRKRYIEDSRVKIQDWKCVLGILCALRVSVVNLFLQGEK